MDLRVSLPAAAGALLAVLLVLGLAIYALARDFLDPTGAALAMTD